MSNGSLALTRSVGPFVQTIYPGEETFTLSHTADGLSWRNATDGWYFFDIDNATHTAQWGGGYSNVTIVTASSTATNTTTYDSDGDWSMPGALDVVGNIYGDGSYLGLKQASVIKAAFSVSSSRGRMQLKDATNATATEFTGGALGYTEDPFEQRDKMCELDFQEGESQDFTSTFSQITNFAENVCDAGYTCAHTGITVVSAGRYTCGMNLSFQNNGAGQFECYMYTNGVQALSGSGQNIGWDRTVSSSASDGTIAARKTITLSAGTVVSWWMETGANETTTWDHGTIWVERK